MFNLMNLFKTKQQILREEFNSQPTPKDWQLISKSYAIPRKIVDKIELLPKDIQEKALFGVTVYLWQDKISGDLRKEEIIGSDSPILEELTSKVKLFGPQNFKDDSGEIFTITKYSPPVTNPMDLPIR